MEVKELIKAKQKLKEDIGSLILSFEKHSEVKVSSIYVRQSEKDAGEKVSITVDL